MKTSKVLIAGLIATSFLAGPTLAEEKCDKNIAYFNPPSGSYKQASPTDATNLKDYAFSNENEVCITLERISEKIKDKKQNTD